MLRFNLMNLAFFLTNIHLLFAMSLNDIGSKHHRQSKGSVSIDQTSSNDCLKESINIDTLENQTNPDTTFVQFTSSWRRKTSAKGQTETSTISSIGSNDIEMIFTVPSTIVSQSIVVQQIFISEVKTNQLLATIRENICLKNSSFNINYLTKKALPHTICLNLRLNQSRNNDFQEIIFCRTIDDYPTNDSSTHESDSSHPVGPSQFFILSQCIIILIMMFIIFIVQTVREKNLMQRLQERFSRSRPYKLIFGNKRASTADGSELTRSAINPATTLQAGLNSLAFSRNFSTHPNHQLTAPLEQQVLAATDLTTTISDRMNGSRSFNNRDLLDVKELTKRMSVVEEHSTT